MPKRAWGIDVSGHRGFPEWEKVKAAGASFGIAKCTDGSVFVDGTYQHNKENCRRNGLVFGGFHYFQPTVEAEPQAENFLKWLDLQPGDFPPIVDMEEKSDGIYLDGLIRLQQMCLIIEQETKMKPIIYTGNGYWTGVKIKYNLLKLNWASDCPLWIAMYPGAGADGDDAQPTLPSDWDKWLLWQCSEKGSVPGVNGGQPPVDMNWFNGSEEELKAWIQSVNPKSKWRKVNELFRQGKIAEAIYESQRK